MKLSITLPSLFPDLLARTIRSVNEGTAGVDYEIVVVSPFKPSGNNVVWVPEDVPRGNSPAHRAAADASNGDILVALSDDFIVQPGWADRLLTFFLERERTDAPYACGLNVDGWPIGTVYGIYYPYFPVLRKESAARIGGYYSSTYKAHFADCDMGLRIWEAGGRCEFCFEARLTSTRNPNDGQPEALHRSSARQHDLQRFVERWQPVYGSGWGGGGIRDFNLNVPGRFFGDYLTDHSIYQNDPAFRAGLLEKYQLVPNVDFLAWD